MKIKFTRHYVWVERIKSTNNGNIPLRTNSLWYRDMRSWIMWQYFLRWCFGSEKAYSRPTLHGARRFARSVSLEFVRSINHIRIKEQRKRT